MVVVMSLRGSKAPMYNGARESCRQSLAAFLELGLANEDFEATLSLDPGAKVCIGCAPVGAHEQQVAVDRCYVYPGNVVDGIDTEHPRSQDLLIGLLEKKQQQELVLAARGRNSPCFRAVLGYGQTYRQPHRWRQRDRRHALGHKVARMRRSSSWFDWLR